VIPDQPENPFALFEHYFAQATATLSPPYDATAVALATADRSGRPAVRMVLLKGIERGDFLFFTNYDSRKGRELGQNPHAALCFHWPPLGIQIRVEGAVQRLDAGESDRYFASRPRGSQLGAWASQQSAPLPARQSLLDRYAEAEQRFASQPVPRPPHWGGFGLKPQRIEFWADEPSRLHDRLAYQRDPESSDGWQRSRLFP
jgi:pyridoxamine 5'-phosphate oxidase